MKTSDFDYSLPKELIAEYPLEKRSSSRLLVYQENIEHKSFKDVVSYFDKGDLLVLNNTVSVFAKPSPFKIILAEVPDEIVTFSCNNIPL